MSYYEQVDRSRILALVVAPLFFGIFLGFEILVVTVIWGVFFGGSHHVPASFGYADPFGYPPEFLIIVCPIYGIFVGGCALLITWVVGGPAIDLAARLGWGLYPRPLIIGLGVMATALPIGLREIFGRSPFHPEPGVSLVIISILAYVVSVRLFWRLAEKWRRA